MNEWVRETGRAGLALLLGCSMLGCNPSQSLNAPRETIRGTVTYKGEPLPAGFLHFYNGTSHVGIGAIKPGSYGAYEASVLAGPVQVIVKRDPMPDRIETPAENGSRLPPSRPRIPGPTLDAKQAKLMDEVQKKYGSLQTAKPLTFVVSPGEQTLNINLD